MGKGTTDSLEMGNGVTADPLEKARVRSILKALNALPRCRAVKRWGGPMGRRGEPDIQGCHKGRAFFLEVKRPHKPLTMLQLRELHEWRESGAIVGRVETAEQALRALFVE